MSFDTLAPWYRAMEAVTAGGLLQRCRTAFLDEAQACRRALLLGEGPGRFLVELLRRNPGVEVLCIEQSASMVRQAVRQLKRNQLSLARVEFCQCDALKWQWSRAGFDLVATHFFLDCFRHEQLLRLVSAISAAATTDARWLLSDFQIPTRGWRRYRACAILAVMYTFFRVATRLPASRLTPADHLLEAAGFRLVARRFANFGLLHADLWARPNR